MKKNEIIDYLKDKLVDNAEYRTESWFIDKEHRRLVFFSCSGDSKVSALLSIRDVFDVVFSNGK